GLRHPTRATLAELAHGHGDGRPDLPLGAPDRPAGGPADGDRRADLADALRAARAQTGAAARARGPGNAPTPRRARAARSASPRHDRRARRLLARALLVCRV